MLAFGVEQIKQKRLAGGLFAQRDRGDFLIAGPDRRQVQRPAGLIEQGVENFDGPEVLFERRDKRWP
jgi:hypothetical protein